MTIFVKNKHTLEIDDFRFKCCIGKNGFTLNKKEGDKKTPKGTFEIENLYFRKDRIKKPKTLLKCIKIKNDMGWCDDTRFPKKYNKLMTINKISKYADILDNSFLSLLLSKLQLSIITLIISGVKPSCSFKFSKIIFLSAISLSV